MDSLNDLLLPGWRNWPPLAEREVQILVLRATGDATLLALAGEVLSPAERERAGRIRVDGAREEFVVGRAALRVLLGLVLRVTAEAVTLETDAAGKPFVPGVYCNVSHSRGLIYVALCRSAAVGVDVEWIDPELEALEIAADNFSAQELERIAKAPTGVERARAFCTLWTRKEAVAKADGRGLALPLAEIHVPDGGSGPAWIGQPASGLALESEEEFHVEQLAAQEGFVAALAVKGEAYPVRFLPNSSYSSTAPGVT